MQIIEVIQSELEEAGYDCDGGDCILNVYDGTMQPLLFLSHRGSFLHLLRCDRRTTTYDAAFDLTDPNSIQELLRYVKKIVEAS